jgi:hypothetical protein
MRADCALRRRRERPGGFYRAVSLKICWDGCGYPGPDSRPSLLMLNVTYWLPDVGLSGVRSSTSSSWCSVTSAAPRR